MLMVMSTFVAAGRSGRDRGGGVEWGSDEKIEMAVLRDELSNVKEAMEEATCKHTAALKRG
jgi:hypothetical protein